MFSYGLAYGWGFGFDPIYILVIVVCMVIGGGAQAYIKSTYKTWQNVPVSFGSTGRDIAQDILIQEDSPHTSIGQVAGELSDYFNPSDNSLHLSPANFDGASVVSVAAACHEAGHAVQTAKGLVFCKIPSLEVSTRILRSHTHKEKNILLRQTWMKDARTRSITICGGYKSPLES